ncbi:MAG TPA: site-specific DNA-methyltransferase [Paludibacter sp.]|mgnify:CR=1 FL=1|nr:site-specific DNA-methyltransferase [Paludibacter sp.]
MKKMKMETKNITSENIEKIGAMFPAVITEARGEDGRLKKAINFELLKQLLSEDVLEGNEAFEFTWVGKKAAMVEAGRPIRKTLRPCKAESKNWETTENLYIEGDNLDVLKLLQESYLGKVKMIYIDPPYNTGNDFIYNDRFVMDKDEYEKQTGLFDEDELKNFKLNNDSNPRFHSDWCSMMYHRLQMARNLLAEDGVIFISIDDNEQANLRKICDNIFGESNFITNFIWEKTAHFGRQKLNYYSNSEHLLVFAKNSTSTTGLKELLVETIKNDLEDAPLYNASNPQSTLTFPAKSVKFNIQDGIYSETTDTKFSLMDEVTVKDGWNENEFSLTMRSRWSPKKVLEEFENGCRYWVKTKNFSVRVIYNSEKESRSAPKQVIFTNRNNPLCAYDRTGTKVGTNDEASAELGSLFETNLFSYPKPVSYIKYLTSLIWDQSSLGFDDDFIILDFFSGSATTAHAVMQLNAEDGGKRKFIMVQLPELTDEKSEAYKAGYKNICEIGKERIRRAGEKIKAELESAALQPSLDEASRQVPDIGFRVFKLDESNMKDVFYKPGDYSQEMLPETQSNIKEDRDDMDLLFACLLEWGLPLSLPHSSEQMEGCTVHSYNDGDLMACFDENITESVVREMARRAPLRVVFRDSSFASSPEKINVQEIFKLLAPNTSIRVL